MFAIILNRQSIFIGITAGLLASVATMGPTEAACRRGGARFQEGQEVRTTWLVDRNTSCMDTLSTGSGGIERIEILSRARNGRAGTAGHTGVAYVPNPGFVGNDEFRVGITWFRRDGIMRRGTWRVSVTVR